MKYGLRAISLLFAVLLLLVSCAQGVSPTGGATENGNTGDTAQSPDDPSGKSDDRPTAAPGETDVVKLTALFRDYVEGTVLRLCADDTVTAFLDGLGETYETVHECADNVQNMDCTGQYARIRTYWSHKEINSGEEITSGLSAGFERGSAVLTPLGMDFGYCLDSVVDLSVLPLEKDDGLARTKLYKEGDKLVYEHQTDRTARLTFTLADGAIASFGFEWEKTAFEEYLEPAVPESADLMAAIAVDKPDAKQIGEAFLTSQRAFAGQLFRAVIQKNRGKDLLISPFSVTLALALAANGAKNETLSEMEALLGGGMPIRDLDLELYSYLASLPKEGDSRPVPAHSIWMKDDELLAVNKEFLEINARYFGADAYRLPFDDETAAKMNEWARQRTGGLIDKIVDDFDEKEVMHLINALCFDAVWMEENVGVEKGRFAAYEGDAVDAEYLDLGIGRLFFDGEPIKDMTDFDENAGCDAVGVTIPYKGGRYAFAAILPREDLDVFDYAQTLSGEKIARWLSSASYTDGTCMLPKFSGNFDCALEDTLTALGMPTAFTDYADFSGIGTWGGVGLKIGRVTHKTAITVDEHGTKAAAVTDVTPCPKESLEDPFSITIDRPFVYMILDTQYNVPLFIGVQTSVE